MKNINQLLNAIKYKLRYGIIVEWYNMWYLILEKKQKVIFCNTNNCSQWK